MASRMRAETQLDYAIFQLTPTRTRCELHIAAQGSTYKLASGLVKPFVSHLKAAEEQLTGGGYSIRLEPPDPDRATWFTKGTMERFVRFVSTPELLERVSTVETELAELEETARQQLAETNDANSSPQIDNPPSKSSAIVVYTGGKSTALTNADKPAKATAADGTEAVAAEEGSKQRVLRALEARRAMLQKEQGMAFARAFAAGFNLENIDDLVLFSECFGASRLRDACMKFVALCKKRQEAGLEIEEIDFAGSDMTQMNNMLYPAMGGAGVESWFEPQAEILTTESEKLNRRGSLDEAARTSSTNGGEMTNEEDQGDAGRGTNSRLAQGHPVLPPWQGQVPQNPYLLHHAPFGPMHYGLAGQVPYPPPPQYMASPFMSPYPDGSSPAMWPMHPPPPQYWPGNQMRGGDQESGKKDSRERSTKHDVDEVHDDTIHEGSLSEDEAAGSHAKGSSRRRRSSSPMRRVQMGRSGGSKQRSGMVVIRNINYIAPKADKKMDGDGNGNDVDASSGSWSDDGGNEDEEEEGTFELKAETLRSSIDQAVGIVENLKHGSSNNNKEARNRQRTSSKKGGRHEKAPEKDEWNRKGRSTVDGKRGGGDQEDSGSGNESESTSTSKLVVASDRQAAAPPHFHSSSGISIDNNRDMQLDDTFVGVDRARNGSSGSFYDALQTPELEYNNPNRTVVGSSSKGTPSSSGFPRDDMVSTTPTTQSKATGGDWGPVDMLAEQEAQTSKRHSAPPVTLDSFMMIPDAARSSSTTFASIDAAQDFSFKPAAEEKVADDSIVLLDRCAASSDGGSRAAWRMPLNLEMEMPAGRPYSDQNLDAVAPAKAAGTPEPAAFEPEDMFMVPERSTYKRAAWDAYDMYDMQVLEAERAVDEGEGSDEDGDATAEEGEKGRGEDGEEGGGEKKKPAVGRGRGGTERDAKGRGLMQEKRRGGGAMAGGGRLGGRPNPVAEAQLRAEKLRAYKAGLQRSKKEKDEEERKRIEDLRNQRRERIAARTLSSAGGVSAPHPPLTRTTTNKLLPNKPNPSSSSSSSSAAAAAAPPPASSASPRDKISSAARLARLSSPKSVEMPVRRSSSSSVADLHKDGRNKTPPPPPLPPSSSLRLQNSTAGHDHSPAPIKKPPPPPPPQPVSDAHNKSNGHAEEEELQKVVRPTKATPRSSSDGTHSAELENGRTEEEKKKKMNRTNGGHAEQRERAIKVDGCSIIATAKTEKKPAAADVLPKSPSAAITTATGSFAKSPTAVTTATGSPATKSPIAASPTATGSPAKSPKHVKRAPLASATVITSAAEEIKVVVAKEQEESRGTVTLPPQQKIDKNHLEIRARTAADFGGNVNGTIAHENGINGRSDSRAPSTAPAEPTVIHDHHHGVEQQEKEKEKEKEKESSSGSSRTNGNAVSIEGPAEPSFLQEGAAEHASDVAGGAVALMDDDDGGSETEVSSLMSENNGGDAAELMMIANGSNDTDKKKHASNGHPEAAAQCSSPGATGLLPERAGSSFVNPREEAILLSLQSSPDPNNQEEEGSSNSNSNSNSSRSRKKWGDSSKAKGLKKLLLLGRKSSRSSGSSSQNTASDILRWDGEEDASAAVKESEIEQAVFPSAGVSSQSKSEAGVSSSSKGSRSFFSLSLRGNKSSSSSSSSTVKA